MTKTGTGTGTGLGVGAKDGWGSSATHTTTTFSLPPGTVLGAELGAGAGAGAGSLSGVGSRVGLGLGSELGGLGSGLGGYNLWQSSPADATGDSFLVGLGLGQGQGLGLGQGPSLLQELYTPADLLGPSLDDDDDDRDDDLMMMMAGVDARHGLGLEQGLGLGAGIRTGLGTGLGAGLGTGLGTRLGLGLELGQPYQFGIHACVETAGEVTHTFLQRTPPPPLSRYRIASQVQFEITQSHTHITHLLLHFNAPSNPISKVPSNTL